MRKILLILAAAVSITTVPAIAPQAHAAYPCPYGYVLFGEFQTVPNLTPPCRLDRGMYNGTYRGLTVTQRCANMGGYLVWVSPNLICRNTDY